jgi:hypothetical protein
MPDKARVEVFLVAACYVTNAIFILLSEENQHHALFIMASIAVLVHFGTPAWHEC